tara:strand:+ start:10007 stop:10672 length:666 start_codon:yes stop_codon:yes gene_type:complete
MPKGAHSALDKLIEMWNKTPDYEHGAFGSRNRASEVEMVPGKYNDKLIWPSRHKYKMRDKPYDKFDMHDHPPASPQFEFTVPPSSTDIGVNRMYPGAESYVIGRSKPGDITIDLIRHDKRLPPYSSDKEKEAYEHFMTQHLSDEMEKRFSGYLGNELSVLESGPGGAAHRAIMEDLANKNFFDYIYGSSSPVDAQHFEEARGKKLGPSEAFSTLSNFLKLP